MQDESGQGERQGKSDDTADDGKGEKKATTKRILAIAGVAASVLSAVGVVVGLFVTVWTVQKNDEESQRAIQENAAAARQMDSVSRRAAVYQTFIGSAVAFDVDAIRYVCLANGQTAPPGELSAAWNDLTASYIKLGEDAWGVEFAHLAPPVHQQKEDIANKADTVYRSLRQGNKSLKTIEDLDSVLTGAQDAFAEAANQELASGTVTATPTATPKVHTRGAGGAGSTAQQASPGAQQCTVPEPNAK